MLSARVRKQLFLLAVAVVLLSAVLFGGCTVVPPQPFPHGTPTAPPINVDREE